MILCEKEINKYENAIELINDGETDKKQKGNENLNGAACHACLMIPETACENGNRLLDRRTIVPTQEKNFKGYFEKLVREVCGISL